MWIIRIIVVLGVLCGQLGRAANAGDLQYDPQLARKLGQLQMLVTASRKCMHEAILAKLNSGSRDREIILGFAKKICAPRLVIFLTDAMGQNPDIVARYVRDLSEFSLNATPGLISAHAEPIRAPDVPGLRPGLEW